MQTIGELVEHEHLKARNFFTEIDHPRTGKLRYPGAPVKYSTMQWGIKRPAPLHGQHNVEIYCDRLDYTHQDLLDMHRTGTI